MYIKLNTYFSTFLAKLVKKTRALINSPRKLTSLTIILVALILVMPLSLIAPQDKFSKTSAQAGFNDPIFVLNYTVTAYSSTIDQTGNDNPFITASGKRVHDGTAASNFLPFGTKIKIPTLFGDKVFTIEDRMSRRFDNRIDIWMSQRKEALRFGKVIAQVYLVND